MITIKVDCVTKDAQGRRVVYLIFQYNGKDIGNMSAYYDADNPSDFENKVNAHLNILDTKVVALEQTKLDVETLVGNILTARALGGK
jgi:hypothetical protein